MTEIMFEYKRRLFLIEDGLLLEVINKTCPLCGEYLHVDDFVIGEDWCKGCDDES